MSSEHKSLITMRDTNNNKQNQISNPPKVQQEKKQRDTSLDETTFNCVRVELPVEDYAELAKRAAMEGVSAGVLVAQAVGKLLQ